jgi:hypothetical protein
MELVIRQSAGLCSSEELDKAHLSSPVISHSMALLVLVGVIVARRASKAGQNKVSSPTILYEITSRIVDALPSRFRALLRPGF